MTHHMANTPTHKREREKAKAMNLSMLMRNETVIAYNNGMIF